MGSGSTYNFRGDVNLSIAGVPGTGFAEGESVTVAWQKESNTAKMGADGEGVFSKMNDLSALWTIRLLPSSNLMDILGALLNQEDGGLAATFPVGVLENSSGRAATSPFTKIQKAPDMKDGEEVPVYEWILISTRTDRDFRSLPLPTP